VLLYVRKLRHSKKLSNLSKMMLLVQPGCKSRQSSLIHTLKSYYSTTEKIRGRWDGKKNHHRMNERVWEMSRCFADWKIGFWCFDLCYTFFSQWLWYVSFKLPLLLIRRKKKVQNVDLVLQNKLHIS
jgi:hypothetical protein